MLRAAMYGRSCARQMVSHHAALLSQSARARFHPSFVRGAACVSATGVSLVAFGALETWQSPLTCATAPTYPGTKISIKADGVKFPIAAICEVGEAGRSCDGSQTTAGVTGYVKFTQIDMETIIIEYEVKGLKPGLHGFHIHEKADFSNGCASAGPHYNPFKKNHGDRKDEDRHVGDLGNIEACSDGVAVGKISDNLIKLFGEYSVAGRSIMVHADPDDLGRGPLLGWPEVPAPPAPAQHTKTTGNAGARIGCGVIKIV